MRDETLLTDLLQARRIFDAMSVKTKNSEGLVIPMTRVGQVGMGLAQPFQGEQEGREGRKMTTTCGDNSKQNSRQSVASNDGTGDFWGETKGRN